MNTQLEIESLPTGGWGYDHFPLSARYAQNSGKEFLGMTGKFHTTWGEFGGFKHPNALRYETALFLALGAKCCIGDQMHPWGQLETTTYESIGGVYEDVEKKEQFCYDTQNIAEIAYISTESAKNFGQISCEIDEKSVLDSDMGVLRILQEGQYLFDIIDANLGFTKYKLIILYASPIKRGNVEVIEDIPTLTNIKIAFKPERTVSKIYDAVTEKNIDYINREDTLELHIDEFNCHKMIVVE